LCADMISTSVLAQMPWRYTFSHIYENSKVYQ